MSDQLEQKQALLLGFKTLQANPLFVSVVDAIKDERDKSLNTIVSGDFPTGTEDHRIGDLQGIYYQQQQIGETRGLSRIVGFLDAIIKRLDGEVKELQAQQQEESNVS